MRREERAGLTARALLPEDACAREEACDPLQGRSWHVARYSPCVAMSMGEPVHVLTTATDCPLAHEATVLTHGRVLAVWVTLIISVDSLLHARSGAHARGWSYDRSRSIRLALPRMTML